MLPSTRDEIISTNICRKKMYDLFNQYGTSVSHKNKSVIAQGGSPPDYVYLIKSGCVSQSFIDPEGNLKTILILLKGDIFGEITLLHNDTDMVITQTFEHTVLSKISSEVFLSVLKDNPEYYYYMSVLISNKFKILMAQLHDSSFLDVSLRLRNLLERLAVQIGIPCEEGIKINMRFTHENLAYMINSTRSTVTKKLAELEEQDFISFKNKYIIVKTKKDLK